MEGREPYIKLSRIRDYGIGKEEGDAILNLSEMDEYSVEQLQNLKEILVDEVDDIDYQIAHEQKHFEHDSKWHYGAKSSRKARMLFVRRIEFLLEETEEDGEVASLRNFYQAALRILDPSVLGQIAEEINSASDEAS